MAPVNIPEGSVFVSKGEGVAAGLLKAADELEADRKWDVRTVTGGYLVREDVAERYQSTLPAPEDDGDDAGNGGEENDDPTGNGEETDEEKAAAAKAEADQKAADDAKAAEDAEAAKKAADEEAAVKLAEQNAAKPDENWTVARIDEWAANQKPPVVFKDGALKADKLAQITG